MTPEAQRIAIAEACGWSQCYVNHQEGLLDEAYGLPPNALPSSENYCYVPDYLNDLNAMHEAEKTLSGPQYVEFITFICIQLNFDEEDKNKPSYYSAHASATQRARAFLRTLNLWTDDA